MEFPFSTLVSSEQETEKVAADFSNNLRGGEVVVLNGELGSGKTFFVKNILLNFNITWGSSPSFAIVNEYKNTFRFYHVDFYRLKSVNELMDIGFYDYLNDEHAIIFIEWGNLFPKVLPAKRIEITLNINGDFREIAIENYA